MHCRHRTKGGRPRHTQYKLGRIWQSKKPPGAKQQRFFAPTHQKLWLLKIALTVIIHKVSQTVSRRDAASEPTWMYLWRVWEILWVSTVSLLLAKPTETLVKWRIFIGLRRSWAPYIALSHSQVRSLIRVIWKGPPSLHISIFIGLRRSSAPYIALASMRPRCTYIL